MKVILLAALISTTGMAATGSIQGRVFSAQNLSPLPFANVMVTGTELGTASDIDGRYRITGVPEGDYVIEASMLGYAGISVSGIEVRAGQAARADFPLQPRAIQVEAVTVSATRARSTVAGLLSNQRQSATVSTGISAEQISRTPDARASDVLKRVTGLTIMEDRFVYVRGLSERYSTTTLNGSNLPSPEPDRYSVPFDIFPSNLLDDLVITKTYTPDQPGDGAGSSIQLTTRDFPERRTGGFSVSYGGNTRSSFRNSLTYTGGALDFLGFDNGSRSLPREIAEAGRRSPIVERGGHTSYGFTEEELQRFGRSFSNVWSPRPYLIPPNQSYSVSYGNSTLLGGRRFGYLGALAYRNSHSLREQDSTNYYIVGAGDTLEIRHKIDTLRTAGEDVLWGGLANLSYQPSPSAKIGLRTTLTQSSDDEVVTYYILPNYDAKLDMKGHRLRWVQRSLFSAGLSGDHLLATRINRLAWRANYSVATRLEPDTREVLYESRMGEGNWRLANESNSGSRFFSELADHNPDAALDLTLPFHDLAGLPAKLNAGVAGLVRFRALDNRRFRFHPQARHGIDVTQSPEEIFAAENIHPDGYQLLEETRPTDNYSGTHLLGAGYAMVDLSLIRNLRLVGGLRAEYSRQRVRTFELFNPGAPPLIGLVAGTDLLPSANLTFKVNPEMNLRAAITQTVSRPSFRELSPFEFTDIGGYATVGDTGLRRALIKNADLGWEWYFSPEEHISLTGFYKHFDHPIEVGLKNATEITWTWRNARSAYCWRLELEAGLSLGRAAPVLSDFSLSGNLAVIESRIRLDSTEGSPETNRERPLQGQSPYAVNLVLSWRRPGIGLQSSLLYNVSGRRIIAVGKYRTPDYYEEPFPVLDWTLGKTLSDHLTVKLSAGNLLDPPARITQGGKTQKTYRKGRSLSLGLSYAL